MCVCLHVCAYLHAYGVRLCVWHVYVRMYVRMCEKVHPCVCVCVCVSVCSKHLLGELADCLPALTSGWRNWLCVQQTLRGPVMRGTSRWTSWRAALTRLAHVCACVCAYACVYVSPTLTHIVSSFILLLSSSSSGVDTVGERTLCVGS